MGKAGVYMGLPFFLLVAMGGGYYGGQWIDRTYGTTQMNFVGLLLGLGVGMYEVVRQVNRLEKNKRG
jgi:F0F1-type ATP synthase assembly protein I